MAPNPTSTSSHQQRDHGLESAAAAVAAFKHGVRESLQSSSSSSSSPPTGLGEDRSRSSSCQPSSPLGSTVNLRCEAERLKTFQPGWRIPFLKPTQLARNGFYFTGYDDIVRCVFCGVEVGCWVRGDDPKVDHQKWSPHCSFVQGVPCGNVPLINTNLDEGRESPQDDEPGETPAQRGYDVCGLYTGNEIRPLSAPENTAALAAVAAPTTAHSSGAACDLWKDLERLGVSKTRGPSHPDYVTVESRIKSFVAGSWPDAHPQKPVALAEAGFFYTGIHDQTVCFHCGGGLKDWDPDDDPWVEHARWFNKCAYVLLKKGRDYVARVSKDKTAMLTADVVQELLDVNGKSREDEEKTTDCTCEAMTDEPPPTREEPEKKAVELCVICCSEDRSIVFLPCGHFVACATCAPSLTKCPVCRKQYKGMVRAYLS